MSRQDPLVQQIVLRKRQQHWPNGLRLVAVGGSCSFSSFRPSCSSFSSFQLHLKSGRKETEDRRNQWKPIRWIDCHDALAVVAVQPLACPSCSSCHPCSSFSSSSSGPRYRPLQNRLLPKIRQRHAKRMRKMGKEAELEAELEASGLAAPWWEGG